MEKIKGKIKLAATKKGPIKPDSSGGSIIHPKPKPKINTKK